MKIPDRDRKPDFALYHIKKGPLTLHISRHIPNKNHNCSKAVKVTETLPDTFSYCQKDEKLPKRAQLFMMIL